MVSKSETDLIITRGLLEKQQTVLPLERIQAIRISENLLRHLMGQLFLLKLQAVIAMINIAGVWRLFHWLKK
jgi:uncharacterized membrane protein YdbT with pleckstrin-like domain